MKRLIALVLALLMGLSVCAFAEGREMATEFVFDMAEGEQVYMENMIFTEPVTIGGDNAQILFVNCLFFDDIVSTSAAGTRVILLGSTMAGGRCIFDNGVQEATIDDSFPKFLSDAPVAVECRDCYGTAAALGDFEIMFNGEVCTLAQSEMFFDNTAPENGMVPYEGQEANCFVVCQWWENGELVMLRECEYDPGE